MGRRRRRLTATLEQQLTSLQISPLFALLPAPSPAVIDAALVGAPAESSSGPSREPVPREKLPILSTLRPRSKNTRAPRTKMLRCQSGKRKRQTSFAHFSAGHTFQMAACARRMKGWGLGWF